MHTLRPSRAARTKGARIALWILQSLLAALFLFAGIAKLTLPVDALAQMSGLPGNFMRFIAVAEISGALGLVLPGALRAKRFLTPLAAAGLTIIMIGATWVTARSQGLAPAAFPFVVGLLLVVVLRAGRRELTTARSRGAAPPEQIAAAKSVA
jgi:uncharacterized membrane protein YphA (DoxX/SURF4 family)